MQCADHRPAPYATLNMMNAEPSILRCRRRSSPALHCSRISEITMSWCRASSAAAAELTSVTVSTQKSGWSLRMARMPSPMTDARRRQEVGSCPEIGLAPGDDSSPRSPAVSSTPLKITRASATFHLDRLAAAGLLDGEYRRLSG